MFALMFAVFFIDSLGFLRLLDSPSGGEALATPLLYALSVSLYTVVNFALWADISTPETIGFNSALGVAVSGWTATFLSTALALRWKAESVPLLRHLQNVDALAKS